MIFNNESQGLKWFLGTRDWCINANLHTTLFYFGMYTMGMLWKFYNKLARCVITDAANKTNTYAVMH